MVYVIPLFFNILQNNTSIVFLRRFEYYTSLDRWGEAGYMHDRPLLQLLTRLGAFRKAGLRSYAPIASSGMGYSSSVLTFMLLLKMIFSPAIFAKSTLVLATYFRDTSENNLSVLTWPSSR